MIEGDKVMVLSDGTLERRTVVTGISNWRHTEITEGLGEGEWIVTSIDREGVEDGASAVRSEKDV